jgi:hypothetical protein
MIMISSSYRNQAIRSSYLKQYVGPDVSQRKPAVCVVSEIGQVIVERKMNLIQEL